MKSSLLFLLFFVFPGFLPADNWKPDAQKAKINFELDGPFGKVHGNFSGLKSTFQFNEKDLAGSSLTASIDPNTVKTGVGLRNTDLRNKSIWLDTKKYPAIDFKSRQFKKTSAGFVVSGDLTLKGTTKSIEIPFTFSSGGNSGQFKGQFTIKREDYHVGNPGGSVGNEILISIEVPVTK